MIEFLFFGLVLPLLAWLVIARMGFLKPTILFLFFYAIASYLLNFFGALGIFVQVLISVLLFASFKKFFKNDWVLRFDAKKAFLIIFIVLVSFSVFGFERYWAQERYLVVRQTFIDGRVPDLTPIAKRSTALDAKLLFFFGENVFDVFGFDNKPALLLINYFFFIGFLLLLFNWLEEKKIGLAFALPFFAFWYELVFIFGAFQEEALIAFFCLLTLYSLDKKDHKTAILALFLGIMTKRIFIIALPLVFAWIMAKNKRLAIILLVLSAIPLFFVQGSIVSLLSQFPKTSPQTALTTLLFVLINASPALFYFYSKAREHSLEQTEKTSFAIMLFAIMAFWVLETKYLVSGWYLQRYLTLFSGIFIVMAASQAQKKPAHFAEFVFLWGATKMFLLGKEIMLY